LPADVWAFGELGNEPGGLHASDSDRVVSNPDGPAAAAADPSAASVAEEGGDAVGSGDVAASALAGDVIAGCAKHPADQQYTWRNDTEHACICIGVAHTPET